MSEAAPQADNPIDLPTGEPVPAPPAASAAPAPPFSNKQPSRPFTARNLATKTDAFLTHLQRCLATPSGIDTVLLFICYTSRLTGALSTTLSQSLLRRDLVALALTLPRKQTAVIVSSSSKSPRTLAVAQLAAVLGARLKSLGSLASEARTIARLWGLLGMYFWAKKLTVQLLASKRRTVSEKAAAAADDATAEPQESKLATLVSWVQLISCTAFQYLENGAYLSGKGVLGWTPKEQGRAYVLSARWLAVYTGLEIGKLLAAIVARRDVKVESEEDKAETEAVRRSMVINLAWTPLTLHWAAETGFLSDLAVGLGGSIPGVVQMRKLWRETAQ
ncbi:hypothetical protein N0V82_001361 [Gnomoniopsis sp. IMI 355080]|nr:hypothetical protein N0V82_001361 [Gnomoniopsis sp. IMI 355080]